MDAVETSRRQDILDVMRLAQCERAWLVRRTRTRHVPASRHDLPEQLEPLVLGKALPCQEDEASPRLQRTPDVDERLDLLAEEHGSQTAERHVENPRPEGVDLRVRLHEVNV